MQPPPEPKPKVSNDQEEPKKRKAPVKNNKTKSVKSANSVDPTPRSPAAYRGKCLYQSRKCENERAIKRNGKPHNLCEEHRSKQNQHQRKFDAKKFSRKRRRGSGSDDDEAPPVAKHHRAGDHLEAEAETRPPMTTPLVAAMRGSYPPMYARLPSIQSPSGPSPALVYVQTRAEAYPRGHVCSDYRPEMEQTPHMSHRPYLQQDPRNSPALPGYSHSELVAASILVQPQSVVPSPSSVATPGPAYSKQERPAVGPPRDSRGPAMITPRVLPSLRIPPSTGSSPFHQVGRIVPSPAQGFEVATPAGNFLPPLVPFGLRRSPTPMSSPNSQNK